MHVVVVGAGVMGRGISRSFADAGVAVTLVRLESDAGLDHPGVLVRVGLPDEVPDLVIEAIFEDADAKQQLYAEVEARFGGRTVIATNTSGLPLIDLACELRWPKRFAGMHYFHPADTFPMVEVVRTGETSDDSFKVIIDALVASGREPIVLERPITGYIINRLQHAILHEAYHLLETGVASAETIDRVAKRLLGPRLAITGLLEQKDLAGLKIHAAAQRSIVPTLAHTGKPSALLQDMVARGDVGAQSGRGFYDWQSRDVPAETAKAQRRVQRLLDFLSTEE